MDALYNKPFPDLETLKSALRTTSHALGFALVTHKSYPNAAHPSRIVLRCCKGRRYTSQVKPDTPDSRRRKNTSSQMTECPYRLTIKIDLGVCRLRRPGSAVSARHNHSLDGVPLAQVRNHKIKRLEGRILAQYYAGVPPLQILRSLQATRGKDVEGITRHDIYNAIRRHVKQAGNEEEKGEEAGE
ncbi:hypothetical protein E4U41_001931 [Claviceps citrina]|nr:hypothetical protein E4U41_001931 [Claviceps citrina]